jgi:flagellar basal-body rod modification protein FlgD
VSSINPTTSTSTATDQPATRKNGTLDKDDFLKLLVTQLQHQDPLNPMDDMQFMSQMAQFSTLEQITNLGADIERLSFSGQVSESVALIGRTVTYEAKDGSVEQGIVQGVEIEDGKIRVSVDGTKIEPASIRSVA